MNIDRAEVGKVTVLRLQGDLDETGVDICFGSNHISLYIYLDAIGFVLNMEKRGLAELA